MANKKGRTVHEKVMAIHRGEEPGTGFGRLLLGATGATTAAGTMPYVAKALRTYPLLWHGTTPGAAQSILNNENPDLRGILQRFAGKQKRANAELLAGQVPTLLERAGVDLSAAEIENMTRSLTDRLAGEMSSGNKWAFRSKKRKAGVDDFTVGEHIRKNFREARDKRWERKWEGERAAETKKELREALAARHTGDRYERMDSRQDARRAIRRLRSSRERAVELAPSSEQHAAIRAYGDEVRKKVRRARVEAGVYRGARRLAKERTDLTTTQIVQDELRMRMKLHGKSDAEIEAVAKKLGPQLDRMGHRIYWGYHPSAVMGWGSKGGETTARAVNEMLQDKGGVGRIAATRARLRHKIWYPGVNLVARNVPETFFDFAQQTSYRPRKHLTMSPEQAQKFIAEARVRHDKQWKKTGVPILKKERDAINKQWTSVFKGLGEGEKPSLSQLKEFAELGAKVSNLDTQIKHGGTMPVILGARVQPKDLGYMQDFPVIKQGVNFSPDIKMLMKKVMPNFDPGRDISTIGDTLLPNIKYVDVLEGGVPTRIKLTTFKPEKLGLKIRAQSLKRLGGPLAASLFGADLLQASIRGKHTTMSNLLVGKDTRELRKKNYARRKELSQKRGFKTPYAERKAKGGFQKTAEGNPIEKMKDFMEAQGFLKNIPGHKLPKARSMALKGLAAFTAAAMVSGGIGSIGGRMVDKAIPFKPDVSKKERVLRSASRASAAGLVGAGTTLLPAAALALAFKRNKGVTPKFVKKMLKKITPDRALAVAPGAVGGYIYGTTVAPAITNAREGVPVESLGPIEAIVGSRARGKKFMTKFPEASNLTPLVGLGAVSVSAPMLARKYYPGFYAKAHNKVRYGLAAAREVVKHAR